jgi:hypothetical protein
MKKLNRYAGVASFSIEQKDLFFGREYDTEKLCSLMLQEQQVLLYSKSGLGKAFKTGDLPGSGHCNSYRNLMTCRGTEEKARIDTDNDKVVLPRQVLRPLLISTFF